MLYKGRAGIVALCQRNLMTRPTSLQKISPIHDCWWAHHLQGLLVWASEVQNEGQEGVWFNSTHPGIGLGLPHSTTVVCCKDIVQKENFHLVWWDGLGAAMALYQKNYPLWLTKHVSDFYGNNVHLYYWSKGIHSPKWEFCGMNAKCTMHMLVLKQASYHN